MNDRDKLNLIYQYFFFNEVKYKNRVIELQRVCKLKNHTANDVYELYLAMLKFEFFEQISREVMSLLNNRYYG